MELNEVKKNQIESKVSYILGQNFTGEKAQLRSFRDRLNFACPYCGDSHENHHKKRGNLYFNNLFFHCFNCSKHVNLVSFFKDHNQSINSTDDLSFYLDYIRNNQVVKVTKDYLEANVFSQLKEYSIPIKEIKEKLRLVDSSESMKLEKYLKARFMHRHLDYFLFDSYRDQLYIFNLTPDKKSTIGWQIRNFKENRTKYVSYNIEKINHLILEKSINCTEEDIAKMNTLSLYFGIFHTDFTRSVNIFEGVIDSLLLSNSIAITGADKPTEMFDDIPTIKYFFDNDIKGRKIMEFKLKKRKKVFMWNLLLKDFKIQPRLADMKSVKDLSDLVEYCWKTKNDAIKNLDRYYTENPLDIRNV
jgi:hypothetical protein